MTELTDRIVKWWKQSTPRYLLLPIIAMIALVAFGVMTAREAIQDQKLDNAVQDAAQREFVQCLSRVDTRQALREVLLGITDLFPDSDGAEAITLLIETQYPMLDVASCGEQPVPTPITTTP